MRGLLLIRMAWMYKDIELGVGILVIFSLVYIALGIMASVLPLACEGPEYLLCFVICCWNCCISFYSLGVHSLCMMWILSLVFWFLG